MLQAATLLFLKDLKNNNDREWFEANRSRYETAREDFRRLTEIVIGQQAQNDPSIASLTAKEAMFRINRDIRFSKNKAPYKINFASSINRSGRMGIAAGYYIHVQPDNKSFAGGGIWFPAAPELKKIRQEIDYNPEEFQSIIQDKTFIKLFKGLSDEEDYKLKREPKGYEKDNPAIAFLKYKCFVAHTSLTDKELTQPSLTEKITAAFKAVQPLINFINRAIMDV